LELFFVKTRVKVNGQYYWDILLSQPMLAAAIKHAVDENIRLSFSNIALARCVHNTVQLLQCKFCNFVSPEL